MWLIFLDKTLLLTSIPGINLASAEEDLLRFIGEKCPLLKEVSFNQGNLNDPPKRSKLSEPTLENVFSGWPKVCLVIFINFLN